MHSRIADASYRLATNPIVTRQVLPAASVALRRLAPHLASRGMHCSHLTPASPTPTPTRTARRDIQIGRDNGNLNPVLLFVPQAEEWMIERFGKFAYIAQPGLNFAIPFVDSIAYKRSMKETTIPIHPQTAITKDNVHVRLDGAVYARVQDSYKASYGIEFPEGMISVLAQSAMRKEVGNLELDQLFLEREKLNNNVAAALDEASQPWGIRCFRYEIADIAVDKSIREAMERQSNAERVRRAEVLESEGYRQRLINESEGDRQSAINKAQGEAESIRLNAVAQAEAVTLLAQAQAESTRLRATTADGLRQVAGALAAPGGQEAMVRAEKYVSELAEMAKASNMVIVPAQRPSRAHRARRLRPDGGRSSERGGNARRAAVPEAVMSDDGPPTCARCTVP